MSYGSYVAICDLSTSQSGYSIALLYKISCGHTIRGLACFGGLTLAAAAETRVLAMSLQTRMVTWEQDGFEGAFAVAYDSQGRLAIADYPRHIISIYKDGKLENKWGTDGKAGNQSGPIQTSLFDEPCAVCFEGRTLYILCYGRLFGSSISRCPVFDLLKRYLDAGARIYKWAGYVDRRRRDDQCNQDRNISVRSGLKHGVLGVRFLREFVDRRDAQLGGHFRSACCAL